MEATIKKTCPVSRAEFAENAQPLEVSIGGVLVQADVKEFSTGSFGWNFCGKQVVKIGDKRVNVQVGINLTVIGSKELPAS